MQIVTTRVAISDQAAGFFITLSQAGSPEAKTGEVRLSVGELEAALAIGNLLITEAESKMNGEKV